MINENYLQDDIRKILFSTAYKMIGEVTASEDIVQDVLSKYSIKKDKDLVNNFKSYLIKSVINHTLNYLQKQKKIRDNYYGIWLPEPVLQTENQLDNQLDIQYGMTVLLTRLSPTERAVFILRESFDFPHSEIGELLQLSTANVRKLYQRAQPKIKQKQSPKIINSDIKKQLIDGFVKAINTGDLTVLITRLKSDIALYSDGGGKVAAAKNILYGEACLKFLLGLYSKLQGNIYIKKTLINNELGILIFEKGQEKPMTIGSFELVNNQIQSIYFVRNPEKMNGVVTK
mgnify:CR=1 FL=1